ncbi:HD domain-containing protein [Corynebacterium pseudotuberculosis]|uniref:HD domain-containing protein n=1 Tax=Corynebacterium pseudotuberculosis TaxID=1719 RepID=UPI000259270E|nr:HD domain-containing protein [Corynebacterium pseudotuberculosis]AFH90735.1 HD domain-containing protein [Corynebacterium pseudotuberculosis 31]AKS13254.1 Guanosine-3',5'-bis(Diphosphate) 3'-pyrophosphohydrolase [Corynebacterium pseudotuberculosis]APB10824.1 guanosine polyphosphate pyrophosphohydrolase [Corynebacterium pseudotuberculosis]APB12870.1 guanosine polyphosphate pyrophosphohydrolase [Corynebacterium pseudotuberculosis]APB14921.1 guanosine polyphosphate pyrophosphohydrolase [Coryne
MTHAELALSPRLLKAINVAATAHRNQYRKGSSIPYVSHVFAVMNIASAMTVDEDILIACLLHDVLEDVPEEFSAEQIEEAFGPRVLSIVREVTKDASLSSWQERNDAYLQHLSSASEAALCVCAADKSHNLASILQDYDVLGDALWDRFNAGKERQQWWYASVYRVLAGRLKEDNPVLRQLRIMVEKLESL